MTVQMVFVLVDADQALETTEEFVNEHPPNLEALCCGDLFIFVKADDVVGIHPARIFSPLSFFLQEAPVHTGPVNTSRSVGTGDIDITFRDLIVAEDIGDNVAHCPVALCCAINDLINCHISSLSFLYSLISWDILLSTLIPGA